MVHKSFRWMLLLLWGFSLMILKSQGYDSKVNVIFFKAPGKLSSSNSATFEFEAQVGVDGDVCRNCTVQCRLDDQIPSNCESREVSYMNLQDGNHTFEVCINDSRRIGCAIYSWFIDTIPPTAYIQASSFTNAREVSVTITFSEPCTEGGGFQCSSINACNLLVYGAGQVMPSTLNVLQPNLKFSLIVGLSPSVQYGRAILVMDKSFCSDSTGNKFTRSSNSSFFVHFDRRSVFVSLRTHIPEDLLQLNQEIRTVQATNSYKNLKVYLYFSEPILNSSADILYSINSSHGMLVPINGSSLGNRRFGFMIQDLSSVAIVTISLNSNSVISRQGTPVSPVAPVTFLYDSERPSVRLSTTSNMRTREHMIPITIKFVKPVFGFNSSHVLISGGNLQSFHEMSRSIYTVEIQAIDEYVMINIPENITGDVAGNKNLPSNILQVRHYSVPMISSVVSIFATASFVITSSAAGLLTVSTASLQSAGAVSRPSSLTTDPARSLFRIACYIQFFAFSRLLGITFPVEYYEFARGLQWSIPYFRLPWENSHIRPVMEGPNYPAESHLYKSKNIFDIKPEENNSVMAASVSGLPLTALEYRSFFESQNMKPEAEYVSDSQSSNGWKDFSRSMFWLAVIGGSLVLLHFFLLLILKFKKKNLENRKTSYGALTFPKFEIFLIILALPCICFASSALIQGGETSGVIVGILLLGIPFFLLLALFLFLSIGITFGKLLQYKEVHKEGQKIHWYRELVRVTLGPGKRGQWTWKNKQNSHRLIMFGPLYEDVRGPPKYMLSQFSGGNLRKRDDRIIDSDDETEDAEAPFIQKLFGILRIYYTFLESVKRVSLGIVAGVYSKNQPSKNTVIVLLSITSFQLFFLVLKKPFIKKKVQLVEIISVFSEVGIFITCLILLENELSRGCEKRLGIFMIMVFLIGFIAQMMNEWYALYAQTRRLDPADKSFLSGAKTFFFGLLIIFLPEKITKKIKENFSVNLLGDGETTGDASFPVERYLRSERRSSGTEKPWLKQLREMAKASFSKEGSGSGSTNDASTSKPRWSGILGGKKSGNSSSADDRLKPRGLSKDLEAIFASK